jgi:manganese efflux pump family protein
MPILPLLLFILPLGLDTLGVSISLGMKSKWDKGNISLGGKELQLATWFITAILFSLAETCMPLLGLAIGYTTSLVISDFMHVVGPLILIGVGLWELLEEGQEYYKKKKVEITQTLRSKVPINEQFQWKRQILLALSISFDELAIGFSLGAVTVSHSSIITIHPVILCILIGIQGFLMTLIGILIGRMLRFRVNNLKELTEFLSAFLLISLGIWLLVT